MKENDIKLIDDYLSIKLEASLYMTLNRLVKSYDDKTITDLFEYNDISKLIVYNKSKNITKENIFIKESNDISELSKDQQDFIDNIEKAYVGYYLNNAIINSDIYVSNTSLFIPNGYHKAINRYCTNKNLSSIDTELISITKALYLLSKYYDDEIDFIGLAEICDTYCRDELNSKINKTELRELITEDNKVQLKNQLNSYIVKFVNEISYKDYYNKKAFNNNDDIVIDYICDILNYIIEEVNIFYYMLKLISYQNAFIMNNLSFKSVLNLFINSLYKCGLDVYIKTLFVDLINEVDEQEINIENNEDKTHESLSIEEHREGCLRYNMKHNTGTLGSTQTCTNCLIGKSITFEDNTQKIVCDLSKLEKEE